MDRTDTEWDEIYLAAGRCLHEWSTVETALTSLFVILHDQKADDYGHPLRMAFEVVQSFEVRLAMVAATVEFDKRCADYAPHFNGLKNKLDRAARKRAEVAHFSIIWRQPPNKPPVFAIKPFFTWSRFLTKTGRSELQLKDVEARAEGFRALARRVASHAHYVHLRREQPSTDPELLAGLVRSMGGG